MGAPRKDNRGLSFKEKLQQAISEVDESIEEVSSSSGGSSAFELGVWGALRTSDIDEKEQTDGPSNIQSISSSWNNLNNRAGGERIISKNFSWNHLSILEQTATLLIKEKERANKISGKLANLESSLGEKDKELAELRHKLELKEEREREFITQNEKFRIQLEILLKSAVRPTTKDESVQIDISPPPRPPAVRPNSINISRSSIITGHHHRREEEQESPPQLSPAISNPIPADYSQELDLIEGTSTNNFFRKGSPYKVQSPPLISDSRRAIESPRTRVYPACSSKRQHLNSSPQDLKPFIVSRNYHEDDEVAESVSMGFVSRMCNGINRSNSSETLTKQEDLSSSDDDEDIMSNCYSSNGGGGNDGQYGTIRGELRSHFTKHNFLICKQINIGVRSPVSSPSSAICDTSNALVSSTTTNNNKPNYRNNKNRLNQKLLMERKAIPKTSLIISEAENCMTTKTPYYINEMEDRMSEMLREAEETTTGRVVEVPAWRIRKYQPLIIEEEPFYGEIEELNDGVFLKRHQRLEIDERRRKRWDSQRVREETYLERLKRRMQERERQKTKRRKAAAGRRVGGATGGVKLVESDDDQEIESVHPIPEDILYIRVSDDIPISVFGHPMPIVERSEFELPWSPRGKSPINSPPRPPSSSSSVSSLPSLPSPTTIPHLRKPSNFSPLETPSTTGMELIPRRESPYELTVDSTPSESLLQNNRTELVSAFASANNSVRNRINYNSEGDLNLFKR